MFFFQPNPLQLTFHLPLHRYLATFMVQAVQHQGVDFQEVCPPERLLKCLLIHLLQIQVLACLIPVTVSIWIYDMVLIFQHTADACQEV